ncbi:hypothetical protein [Streptomyces sp. e14]|uniref:hypothetical protein n=1 Tax=Streptomyces sp. e14 TaxID=645465 RepID=UPI0012E218FC|nr:hypothetical protein [Streptomyces sp. e14]
MTWHTVLGGGWVVLRSCAGHGGGALEFGPTPPWGEDTAAGGGAPVLEQWENPEGSDSGFTLWGLPLTGR